MTLLQSNRNAKALHITRTALGEYVGNLGDQMGTRRRTHISRPRGRRWVRGRIGHHTPLTLTTLLMWMILVLSTWSISVDAAYQQGQHRRRLAHRNLPDRNQEILFDRSPPPVGNHIERRQAESEGSEKSTSLERESFSSTASAVDKSATGTIVTPSDSSASTTSPAGSSSTSVIGAPISDSAVPKPFDGGIGTNYTQQSCPTFLRSFLSNDTVISCVPLSLLLQNSVSFFAATKSKDQISSTLDASCKVVFPACSSIMASFAQQIRSDDNCGQDYRRQNPLVSQAYNGLVSYGPLFHAGCQKNNKGEYCFADAITNETNPSDSYVYYLPLGLPLPSPSQPSCSDCLLQTMEIFQSVAGNKTQPINPIYVDAAQMIDLTCGPTFVNASLPSSGSDTSSAIPSSKPITSISGFFVALVLAVAHLLTQF